MSCKKVPKGDLLLKIESVAFLNLPLLVIFEEEWILNSVQCYRGSCDRLLIDGRGLKIQLYLYYTTTQHYITS